MDTAIAKRKARKERPGNSLAMRSRLHWSAASLRIFQALIWTSFFIEGESLQGARINPSFRARGRTHLCGWDAVPEWAHTHAVPKGELFQGPHKQRFQGGKEGGLTFLRIEGELLQGRPMRD